MKKILLILTIFTLSFTAAPSAEAASASLYLFPSIGNYTVGNTFSIQLKVNSGGVAINSADGTLIFDPDKLEVKNISKTNSVFSLWIQDPTFSNSAGTIAFVGGKPSPGYAGSVGTIITITFKAKTSGTANLTFATGSVLADDGQGTNVLANMGSGLYKLISKQITPLPPAEEEEYVPSVVSDQVPAAPVIYSPTHSEEDEWYSNNNPEFSWGLPSDVTAVRLLIGHLSTAIPNVFYSPAISEKKVEDLSDGIWYFSARFKNQYGWGYVTHRKVLIDTEPPEPFEVIIDNENDPTNPIPFILFKTNDFLSGVKYYQVELNKETLGTTTHQKVLNNPYQSLPLPSGEYLVDVKAFDKAWNFSSASTSLEILPIEAPKITDIPTNIRIGEVLIVKGEALPEITVRVYIKKEGEEEPILEKVEVDSGENFILTYHKTLTEGNYLVWVQSEDERGALSHPSQKYFLEVGLPPFLKFGKIALDYLSTVITLIILIVGVISVIFYSWYRISVWRKRVRKETKEVAQSVAAAFHALKEEVSEQIEMLDKKPGLTKKEKEIRDKLKEALNISEKFIDREIKDIEKELE